MYNAVVTSAQHSRIINKRILMTNNNDSSWQCPVCFESVTSGGVVPQKFDGCVHSVCCECISRLSQQVCPLCRAPFTDTTLDAIDWRDRTIKTFTFLLVARLLLPDLFAWTLSTLLVCMLVMLPLLYRTGFATAADHAVY